MSWPHGLVVIIGPVHVWVGLRRPAWWPVLRCWGGTNFGGVEVALWRFVVGALWMSDI